MMPIYSSSLDPETWVVGEMKELTTKGGPNIKYNIKNKIGSGASSVVFLAEELTDKGELRRDVILKVLKRGVSDIFFEGLAIEESVLRDVYDSLRKHGVENPYIVKFYNSSPKTAEIHYIAMELARGKDIAALVGQRQNVLPQIQELHISIEKVQYQVQEFAGNINENSPVNEIIEDIKSQFEAVQNRVQELQKQTLAGLSRTGMEEIEILDVFVQASKVTQCLNEDAGRSFRDFQLKNFYYDQHSRQLKIIDWNVVTDNKGLNPRKDVFFIANSLFYLFSRVSLEQPVNPALFTRMAGEGWFVGASLALQLAVERVLTEQQDQSAYAKVYDWSAKSEDSLQPVSTMEAFGNALEMIIRYHKLEPGELITTAEKFAKEGKLRDAKAVLQVVDVKISSGISLVHSAERKMKEIRSEMQGGQYSLMDAVSLIKSALNSMNRDEAVQKAQNAIAEQPDSLTVRRWHVVVSVLKDKPRGDLKALWEGGQIQNAMLALDNHLWDRAAEGFKDALGSDNLLVLDARFNKSVEKLAHIFSMVANDRNEYSIQAFLQAYEAVDADVKSGALSYSNLILAEWSQWQFWRSRVEQLRMERNELEQLYSKIRASGEKLRMECDERRQLRSMIHGLVH